MAQVKNKDNQREPRKIAIEVSDGVLIPEKSDKTLFSAWRFSFVGAITLLVALPIIKPDPFFKILKFIFPEGLIATLEVTLLSIIFAVIVGLLVSLARISRIKAVSTLATVYVEIIRGIPLLVQLFYIYYALAKFIQVPDVVAAVIGMTVCYGAYIGEIFRAGILSVPKGQMEAALALGLSRGQAIIKVVLPQTMKIVLPPLGNESIALLKDSSLVSIVAVADIFRRGREFASTTYFYFETFTIIALIYLVMTLFLSRIVGMGEERMKRNAR